MRAIVYNTNGSSDVLSLVDRPVPDPGPGEVRVRLARAGVNPTDWKARAGISARLAFDEVVPGQDGAGVIDAVGDGVDRAIGQRVWLYLAQHGRPYGTAAQYVVVPAEQAVPLPDGASYDLGASLGVPAMTAHRALTSGEVARLAPGALHGRIVLVQGGAGAVGNAAIQLARWSGATVITTVSGPQKAALAQAAGAHAVINYRTEAVAEAVRSLAPDGVDLVVEVAPATNDDLDRSVIAMGGTIAIYANNGGEHLTLPIRETYSLNLRYQFILLYTITQDQKRAAAEDVAAAVAAGGLRVTDDAGVPLHHYPLDQTAAAHDAVEAGAVGKVLLDIEQDLG